jgi:RNA polymerase sigma factor (sigma-70 family)
MTNSTPFASASRVCREGARRHDEIFAESDVAGLEWSLPLSFESALLDRQQVETCLRNLDEPARSLLFLRHVVGKTSREIAEDLGQSPAAVRMKIMRVRDMLRERLGNSR